MKQTITTCDICGDPIRPGTRMARQFVVNSEKIDCCGTKCFLDFWADHYDNWDSLQVSLNGPNIKPQLAILKKEAK